ncbi:MAG: CDF family Co(II)/Ni(II) efflux transporter DmeF [Prochlorotrichaceae cyanobacterium]
MQLPPPEQWQHSHNFLVDQHQAEKKTQLVMFLTAVTMLAEIAAGLSFGSMALLADGWHMATHVAAFGITVFAYRYARHHASDPRYTFGTGKVSVLGGFASAVALAVVAFIMAFESLGRLFQPHSIQFNEAIGIAVLGLVVNLVSAWLLQGEGDHHHHHHDSHPHDSHSHDPHPHEPETHRDHNLQAAYIHVLADALTSVLAIVALFAGKFLGWLWLDAVMGLVGAGVITQWGYALIRETGAILLDGGIDKQIKLDILNTIEANTDNRVVDLHVWHLSPHHLSATVSLITPVPQAPEYYKQQLRQIPALTHIIVEVTACD